MVNTPKTDWHYAVGAAVLAAVAGAAIGLLLGGVMLFGGWGRSIALPVASGATAGALAGLFMPAGAMDFVEGTVHFFLGLFASELTVTGDSGGSPERPRWLRLAGMFGVAFAVALWLLAEWL